MPIDPPIKDAPRFPVSAAVALSSIALSILWWTGQNFDALVATRDTALKEPWTLFSSTLLHVNFIHLLFNLSWWWPFACRIEYAWGRWKLIGITVLIAAVSGAAQVAFSSPGVGLSGVVYGLFAMFAVAQGTHPAFYGLVTKRTIYIFAGWFVLCVVLTVANILPIANIAHGVGAAAGWLLGRAIVAAPRARKLWIAALAALCVTTGASLAVNIPWANNNPTGPSRVAKQAEVAFDKGEFAEAARYYEQAHRESPDEVFITVNLGITYQRLGRHDEALPLYMQAAGQEERARRELSPVIAAILTNQAYEAIVENDLITAHERVTDALQWSPGDKTAIKMLDQVKDALSLPAPAPSPDVEASPAPPAAP
ncbi:MAG: rhomboid family intramembrane serine protease [Phycisphaerales bacterium]|nr:rhomboid family intramembrane serine protease [Phycisphaerales bacterium]